MCQNNQCEHSKQKRVKPIPPPTAPSIGINLQPRCPLPLINHLQYRHQILISTW
ncbi:uncharacterized protein LAESUDRAFT_724396 [Laetiporus sulphureus 93-53]|uniref:Uncharacterized protein n=1 Tax=Laetiporus sulphureus 93-53 TaxID=1314785 RepID=A0A165EXC3_9APHY|nr:uncharacterized protein LAESUDRAFT_724396 [Laetiporus sulphureus 93-53]KZT07922.1 hypothetical protein LAESUDRAFT_724396 [Laetiporus sulphureus 93-53]